MAISSAQIQIVVAATASESFGVTTKTGQTAKRDTIVFANGVNATCITAVIDTNITITSNSTTVTLSSLTNTIDGAFAQTELKGWRLAAPSTNAANITVTSNMTGVYTGAIPANTVFGMLSGHETGFTIAGTNNVTVAGNNGDVLELTLFSS
jgi:hypothetical protein